MEIFLCNLYTLIIKSLPLSPYKSKWCEIVTACLIWGVGRLFCWLVSLVFSWGMVPSCSGWVQIPYEAKIDLELLILLSGPPRLWVSPSYLYLRNKSNQTPQKQGHVAPKTTTKFFLDTLKSQLPLHQCSTGRNISSGSGEGVWKTQARWIRRSRPSLVVEDAWDKPWLQENLS